MKSENQRLGPRSTALVNFMQNTEHPELCQSCAGDDYNRIHSEITTEISQLTNRIAQDISAFPLFTSDRLPSGIDFRLIGLVTANATVGTGIFNEFSQGFSDFFGVVNTTSGMTHKVNSGEQAVRSIIAQKALSLGANCVLSVDIDYGSTANNAATVNMQGTAAVVPKLDTVLTDAAYSSAIELSKNFRRMGVLNGWLSGNFEQVE